VGNGETCRRRASGRRDAGASWERLSAALVALPPPDPEMTRASPAPAGVTPYAARFASLRRSLRFAAAGYCPPTPLASRRRAITPAENDPCKGFGYRRRPVTASFNEHKWLILGEPRESPLPVPSSRQQSVTPGRTPLNRYPHPYTYKRWKRAS